MNKTIKFRAWTGKQMIYQDKQYLASFIRRVVPEIIQDQGGEHYASHESYLPNGGVIDEYLTQWTGMLDERGKEIYVGDILRATESGLTIQVLAGFSTPAISLFLAKDTDGDRQTLFSKSDGLEVIGNIFEGGSLNLQWAREALLLQGLPVTAENLVTITGQQVTEWQARVWLASQAEGNSHETEEA